MTLKHYPDKLIKQATAIFPAFLATTIILGTWLICLFSPGTLFANSQHSHKEIQAEAVKFVRSQIPEDIKIKQIKAGRIDPRIQFKQCSQALETYSTMKKNITKNWTIGIRCNDEIPWRLYIPVKAVLTQKMLVSKTTITRGELISADKVQLIEQEISHQNHKHFSQISHVIGREARKTISPNRIINSSMLQQAFLVRKKETVLIYARNKNIRVSMQGTALKNGLQNEMIKVRNNSSKKIIDALVIDRGVVAVNF